MKIFMILAVLNLPFFKYIINNQTLFLNAGFSFHLFFQFSEFAMQPFRWLTIENFLLEPEK